MATMTRLEEATRIVVKIGSALLVDRKSGQVREPWFSGLIQDIADLKAAGKDVTIVSSGAIALGRARLGLARRGGKLDEAQAAAAVGQIALARAYEEALAARNLRAAQILLTLGDTEERRRYLNARGTIETLLRLGAVPVINENDTVATAEIRYGDNDRLAARVASMISADCVVLLSDVDGFYTAPPENNPDARHIPEIERITPEIEAMAGDAGTDLSTGGMVTKLAAARIARESGAHMVIASGHLDHPIRAIRDGARCTWFVAGESPAAARKRWIVATLKPCGRILVDTGAGAALARGNSLLPAGVTRIDGTFNRGDAVIVEGPDGRELARGLAAYSAADAAAIAGRKTGEIAGILGYSGRPALIHRDDLVLSGS